MEDEVEEGEREEHPEAARTQELDATEDENSGRTVPRAAQRRPVSETHASHTYRHSRIRAHA